MVGVGRGDITGPAAEVGMVICNKLYLFYGHIRVILDGFYLNYKNLIIETNF